LPIQDLDLYEICELPSECLHMLVDSIAAGLDQGFDQTVCLRAKTRIV
jgi:hypothetical protein